MSHEYPPLPAVDDHWMTNDHKFTADQLHAYAAPLLERIAELEGAVEAERERWRDLLRECEPLLADMTGPHWPARVEVLRRVQAALRPNDQVKPARRAGSA